jgi:hypothetical protein
MHYASRIYGCVILGNKVLIVIVQAEWYSSMCIGTCDITSSFMSKVRECGVRQQGLIKNILRTWNSLKIRICQPTHQIQYGEIYIKKVCVNEGFLTFLCAMDLFESLVAPVDPFSEKRI